MRKHEPILVDTDGLYLLGLMVQRYQNSNHTQYEYMALEKLRLTIRTELKARADEHNRVQSELDIIAENYI